MELVRSGPIPPEAWLLLAALSLGLAVFVFGWLVAFSVSDRRERRRAAVERSGQLASGSHGERSEGSGAVEEPVGIGLGEATPNASPSTPPGPPASLSSSPVVVGFDGYQGRGLVMIVGEQAGQPGPGFDPSSLAAGEASSPRPRLLSDDAVSFVERRWCEQR